MSSQSQRHILALLVLPILGRILDFQDIGFDKISVFLDVPKKFLLNLPSRIPKLS
jgi:hypothetical protein